MVSHLSVWRLLKCCIGNVQVLCFDTEHNIFIKNKIVYFCYVCDNMSNLDESTAEKSSIKRSSNMCGINNIFNRQENSMSGDCE